MFVFHAISISLSLLSLTEPSNTGKCFLHAFVTIMEFKTYVK